MFKIPVATKKSLGTVKIGDNINVDENGVISVAEATSTNIGLIKKPLPNLSVLASDANGDFIAAQMQIEHVSVNAGPYQILNISYPIGSIYIKSLVGEDFNIAPPGCNAALDISDAINDKIISGAIHYDNNNNEIIGYMRWKLLPSDFCPWSTYNANEYG